jgi:acetyltransferase-like isoleucine patch superfamily enzyme
MCHRKGLSGKGQHCFDNPNLPIREQGGSFEKVNIGENCWIGNSALIMANVQQHSVVAAGSVLTTDLTGNSVIAGNPAKKLRDIEKG